MYKANIYKLIHIFLCISLIYPSSFGYSSATINTYPESAYITVNGADKGLSPIMLQVQNGLHAKKNVVCAEKEGYKKKCITLDQKVSTTGALAACFGCFCSLFFLPGIGLILFATEHKSSYTIRLSPIDE